MDYCYSIGVEVIPCIQTLAHLNQIFRWDSYKNINEISDILLVDDERTYELIDNMLRTVNECFTSKIVHIGMDEAFMLGRGKLINKNGYESRFDILHRHLERVMELVKKYGLKPIMWSDMFFTIANGGEYYLSDPAIITEKVVSVQPEGVDLVYWDYYCDYPSRYKRMLEAREDIASFADDYQRAIYALDEFIVAFRKLWFKENKPHGFDVHELRLGGLLLRLRSQRERLLSFASGEIDVIEELEEDLLEYIGPGNKKGTEMLLVINSWAKTATPNVI